MIAFAKQFEPPSFDDILKLAVAKMLKDIKKQEKTTPLNVYPYKPFTIDDIALLIKIGRVNPGDYARCKCDDPHCWIPRNTTCNRCNTRVA